MHKLIISLQWFDWNLKEQNNLDYSFIEDLPKYVFNDLPIEESFTFKPKYSCSLSDPHFFFLINLLFFK